MTQVDSCVTYLKELNFCISVHIFLSSLNVLFKLFISFSFTTYFPYFITAFIKDIYVSVNFLLCFSC